MARSQSEWATLDVLRQIVAYEPNTGTFTDKRDGKLLVVPKMSKRIRIKKPDGTGGKISPGLTAWMLMTGETPKSQVNTLVEGSYAWENLFVNGHSAKELKEVKVQQKSETLQYQINALKSDLDAMTRRHEKQITECLREIAYLKLLVGVTAEIERRSK